MAHEFAVGDRVRVSKGEGIADAWSGVRGTITEPDKRGKYDWSVCRDGRDRHGEGVWLYSRELEPLAEVWKVVRRLDDGSLVSAFQGTEYGANTLGPRQTYCPGEEVEKAIVYPTRDGAKGWLGRGPFQNMMCELWRGEAVLAGDPPTGICGKSCRHLVLVERVAVYRDGAEVKEEADGRRYSCLCGAPISQHAAVYDGKCFACRHKVEDGAEVEDESPQAEKEDRAMATGEEVKAMAAVVAATMLPNNRGDVPWGTGNAKPHLVVRSYRDRAEQANRCARADLTALADALEHLFAVTTTDRQQAIRDGTVDWPEPAAEQAAHLRKLGESNVRLRESHSEMSDELASATLLADHLEEVNQRLRDEKCDLEARLASAKADASRFETRLADRCDQVDALIQEVAAAKAEAETFSALADTLGKSATRHKAEAADLNVRLENARSAVLSSHKTAERHRGEADDLRGRLEKARRDAAEWHIKADDLRKRLKQAEDMDTRFRDHWKAVFGSRDDPERAADAEVEDLVRRAVAAEADAARLRGVEADLRGKLAQAQSDRDTLRGRLGNADKLVDEYGERLKGLRVKVDGLEEARAADGPVVEAAVAWRQAYRGSGVAPMHRLDLASAVRKHPSCPAEAEPAAEPPVCDQCGAPLMEQGDTE